MTTILGRLLRARPRARADHLRFTVYTRQQCCCCHRALDLLREEQARHGFALEMVDIDTDPALVAEHGSWVPVVAVDGKVRFRGVVNPALLGRLLAAEAASRARQA